MLYWRRITWKDFVQLRENMKRPTVVQFSILYLIYYLKKMVNTILLLLNIIYRTGIAYNKLCILIIFTKTK